MGVKYSYKLCITGDTYRQAMRTVVRELCEHDIDGVYFDAPTGYRGISFCKDCRSNFKRFSGMDPERLGNVRDVYELSPDVDMKALIAWYEWANKLTEEDLLDFRKIIHGAGKFMLCHNGGVWRGPSPPFLYRFPDGFMVEYFDPIYQRLVEAMMGASMGRPTRKLAMMYMGAYDVSTDDQPPLVVCPSAPGDLPGAEGRQPPSPIQDFRAESLFAVAKRQQRWMNTRSGGFSRPERTANYTAHPYVCQVHPSRRNGGTS